MQFRFENKVHNICKEFVNRLPLGPSITGRTRLTNGMDKTRFGYCRIRYWRVHFDPTNCRKCGELFKDGLITSYMLEHHLITDPYPAVSRDEGKNVTKTSTEKVYLSPHGRTAHTRRNCRSLAHLKEHETKGIDVCRLCKYEHSLSLQLRTRQAFCAVETCDVQYELLA